MRIYKRLSRALACLIIRKRKKLNLTEPVITFTFDDVPDSGFINGKAILKKYGYQGTYYIALGLLDKSREDGDYFDPAYLKEVVDDGGELACHTFNHIHLYTSNKKEIAADLAKNQEKLNELVPGYTFSNFSYPYGEQSFVSKIIIRDRYTSARGVMNGINSNPVDLNNLKSFEIDNSIKLEDMYSLIDRTIASKGWLIFFAHDVEENFSPWGCPPEYLESIVKYCYDKKVKVLTVEKVLNL